MRTLHLPTTLALAAIAAALMGCGDDLTDPDSLLQSVEAEAVLRSAAALPALPRLVDRAVGDADAATRATLQRAAELWTGATGSDDAGSRGRRQVAARYAAPGLAALVPAAEWETVRGDVDAWIATADAMLRHLSLPAVDIRLRSARGLLDRADRATDAVTRAQLTLLAASELVETTPRHVARTLVADADVAVRQAGASPARGQDARLERAYRLKDWAARAVEEESYLLAIQRAYYALQLVEGR